MTKTKKELTIKDIAELKWVANELLAFAGRRKKITFAGEIGTGKTTLIQSICKQLGVEESVTSPTFSIVNEYKYFDPQSKAEKTIYHIDLYRLKNIEEAIDIGIEDLLYNDNYCFIEWPEIIEDLLPEDRLKISLEIIDNSYRKILFL